MLGLLWVLSMLQGPHPTHRNGQVFLSVSTSGNVRPLASVVGVTFEIISASQSPLGCLSFLLPRCSCPFGGLESLVVGDECGGYGSGK